MAQIVDIPGVGRVRFPDGMTPEQINAAAKSLHDKAQPAPVFGQGPPPGSEFGQHGLPAQRRLTSEQARSAQAAAEDAFKKEGFRGINELDAAFEAGTTKLADALPAPVRKGVITGGDAYKDYTTRMVKQPLAPAENGYAKNQLLGLVDPLGSARAAYGTVTGAPMVEGELYKQANEPIADVAEGDTLALITNLMQRVREEMIQAGSMGAVAPGPVTGRTVPKTDSAIVDLGVGMAGGLLGQPWQAAPAFNTLKGGVAAGLAGGASMAEVDPQAPLSEQVVSAGTQAGMGGLAAGALHTGFKGLGAYIREIEQIMGPLSPEQIDNLATRMPKGGPGLDTVNANMARKPSDGRAAIGDPLTLDQARAGKQPQLEGQRVSVPRQSPVDVPGGMQARMAQIAARKPGAEAKKAAKFQRQGRVIAEVDPAERQLQQLHDAGAFRDRVDQDIYRQMAAETKDLTPAEIIVRMRDERAAVQSPAGTRMPTDASRDNPYLRPVHPPVEPDAAPLTPRERSLRDAEVDAAYKTSQEEKFLKGPKRPGQPVDTLAGEKVRSKLLKKANAPPPPPDVPPPPPGGGQRL